MAISRTDVGLVDPLAADLIYFSGSMPIPRVRFPATSAIIVLGAIAAAGVLLAMSPITRAEVRTASGAQTTPTPSPTHASLVLNIAAGGPRTNIGVTGYFFPPKVTVTLYWDTPSQVATSVPTDSDGYLATTVNPFPGSGPGAHTLCGSTAGLNQAPPCATFTVQGPPTPTPPAAPSPSASASGSPSTSPSSSASASRVLTTDSGQWRVITKPPFVFLPIIVLLALLAVLAYWLLMRVDRTPVLPSASVVHRSARPDFGPPPSRPAASPPAAPPATQMQPPPADAPPPLPPEPPAY